MTLSFSGRRAEAARILTDVALEYAKDDRAAKYRAHYSSFSVTQGALSLGLGRYAEAREAAVRARKALEEGNLSGHIQYAVAHQVEATALFYLGELQKCKEGLATSRNMLSGLLGSEHPRLISAWQAAGLVEFKLGNLREARTNFGKALDLVKRREGFFHFDLVRPLAWRAVSDLVVPATGAEVDEIRSTLGRSDLRSTDADRILLEVARLLVATQNLNEHASLAALGAIDEMHVETGDGDVPMEVIQAKLMFEVYQRTLRTRRQGDQVSFLHQLANRKRVEFVIAQLYTSLQ